MKQFNDRQIKRIVKGIKRAESIPLRGPASLHRPQVNHSRLIAWGNVEACDWDESNTDGRVPFMGTMPSALAYLYYPLYNDDNPADIKCDWMNEVTGDARIFNPHPFSFNGYMWVTPVNGIYIVDAPLRMSNSKPNAPIWYADATGAGTTVAWNEFSGWEHIANEIGSHSAVEDIVITLKQTMVCRVRYNITNTVGFTPGSADRFSLSCSLKLNDGGVHQTQHTWKTETVVGGTPYDSVPSDLGVFGANPIYVLPNSGEVYLNLSADDVITVELVSEENEFDSYHTGTISIEPLYSF